MGGQLDESLPDKTAAGHQAVAVQGNLCRAMACNLLGATCLQPIMKQLFISCPFSHGTTLFCLSKLPSAR